jgi:AAA family ATP:ADP antiporter
MCVFFGSLQNCLARASKYTVFDATKELAFVPLNKESKLKGKAAIDGVGSRLGKSGGSLMHQSLLMVFGTVTLSTPYVAALLLGAIGVWISAVRALGKRFNALSPEEKPATSPVLEKVPDHA